MDGRIKSSYLLSDSAQNGLIQDNKTKMGRQVFWEFSFMQLWIRMAFNVIYNNRRALDGQLEFVQRKQLDRGLRIGV